MIDPQLLNRIADALAADGYIILDQVFPVEWLSSLENRAKNLRPEQFKSAGIGRELARQHHVAIRNDEIRWIEKNHPVDTQYLAWMEQLRLELNRRLYLGLFDFESHYSHYAPGAYYKKHLDAFRGQSNRIVSTILYLNKNWQPVDGGELRVYAKDGTCILMDILPELGRLVIFLSDVFPHEVMQAHRDRYSIAGWFRSNNSSSSRVDPA